jgi:hypothetical protein
MIVSYSIQMKNVFFDFIMGFRIFIVDILIDMTNV